MPPAPNRLVRIGGILYLDEANVLRLLAEALTADVKAVLPDKTGLVCADTAVAEGVSSAVRPLSCQHLPLAMPSHHTPSLRELQDIM